MRSPKSLRRISILSLYPPGNAPGPRFRYEQYLPIARLQGFQVKLFSFFSTRQYLLNATWQVQIFGVLKSILTLFFKLPRICYSCNIMIYREAAPIGPPIIEWIIAKVFRKKIIYDFDDAIWMTDNLAESKFERWVRCRSKVAAICRWSYKVSCGNRYLAAYAQQFNSNVVVNPTTIDTENQHNPALHRRQRAEGITIGWTGSHSTLKYLEAILPVIRQLLEQYVFIKFLVIANRNPAFDLPRYEFRQWSAATEIADLAEIDIGIMPLPDDEWSKGKCGFKALQYMAMEIPAVVSPVGVNTEIIEAGYNGFLCATPEEWFHRLSVLIEDADLRRQIGKQGRQTVIDRYSVASNTATFLSLFE